jgi:hypothetical protein
MLRSSRQVQKAAGFNGGYLAISRGFAFWTVTSWHEEQAMRAYRNSAAHVKAMPKLIEWCDEASVAHWTSEEAAAPDPTFAASQLAAVGKLSKVRRPSAGHSSGNTWPDQRIPARGRNLDPSTTG